jgi:hypothetical protein
MSKQHYLPAFSGLRYYSLEISIPIIASYLALEERIL